MLFCSAPLSSFVSGAIQVSFCDCDCVIVISIQHGNTVIAFSIKTVMLPAQCLKSHITTQLLKHYIYLLTYLLIGHLL